MNVTWKQVILTCIVSFFAFVLGSTMCARTKEAPKVVPKIITVYDTVDKEPKWLTDSIKKWRKRVHTTDTVNLTPTVITLRDVHIPVNAPAEERPNIWPVLSVNGGRVWGDTTVIRSFSLRTGTEAVSKLFSTGYITDLEADFDSNSTPRITFTPFPASEKHGFWHNPKVFGYGILAGIGLITVISVVK